MTVSFDSLGVTIPVIPVVVIEDSASAVDLARALLAGGLNVIEVTLRTPAALESIRAIKSAVFGMSVGAGTVNTTAQVEDSIAAGADFLVSPGAAPGLADAAGKCGIPWLPGATTPGEVMRLSDLGFQFQKFFPAETSGGVGWLKAVHAPLPDIMFCPTGGITTGNARDYLALPNVPFVGGTWLATEQIIRERRWDELTERARDAVALGR
jgi:2-dehydro-3-deoxyphosphogluconate aldolase/(4S)-4-hydroxy-2-oxoglutarate aldolase